MDLQLSVWRGSNPAFDFLFLHTNLCLLAFQLWFILTCCPYPEWKFWSSFDSSTFHVILSLTFSCQFCRRYLCSVCVCSLFCLNAIAYPGPCYLLPRVYLLINYSLYFPTSVCLVYVTVIFLFLKHGTFLFPFFDSVLLFSPVLCWKKFWCAKLPVPVLVH